MHAEVMESDIETMTEVLNKLGEASEALCFQILEIVGQLALCQRGFKGRRAIGRP